MNDIVKSDRPWCGGSSVAAILGLPNAGNRTPLTECLRLWGKAPELDAADYAFFEDRKNLEPFIAGKVKRRFGITPTMMNIRYFDQKYPFLAAEIDFETETMNREFKSSKEFLHWKFGEEGSDNFPIEYAAQVQFGLGIRPKDEAFLDVAIGFDDFRTFPLEPMPEVIEGMRERVIRFWHEHVLTGIPPPPTTLEDVKLLFPKSLGNSILADEKMMDSLARHAELNRHVKEMEEEADRIKLNIQVALGDADQALKQDGRPAVTWRNNKDSIVLDKDSLIQVYQEELLKIGPLYLDWITEQRKALTSTKENARR